MDGQPQLSAEVAESIQRCAEALSDLPALKNAVFELRAFAEPHAQLAAALFDLERARQGDAEARGAMLELADQLLVFWRAGNGLELARAHPALEDLWETAAALLASFEAKRFSNALKACWDARREPVLLQVAIRDLQPEGNRRVEFARCLYHLELARQFVDSSRVEFAKRAGLLSDAYQSQEVADLLVGDDAGLRVLWDEVAPYLDEFFEMLEQDAARRSKAEPPAQPSDTLDPDVMFEAEEDSLTDEREVPPFGALMKAPPPPAPNDLTPPGAWIPPFISPTPRPVVPPPPPRPSIPPPRDADAELDLVDIDEAPPIRRTYNLDVSLEEDDPDAQTLAFWKHTVKELSLLPDPSTPRVSKRLLNADSRAERKQLTAYLDSLDSWLQVDDARSFAALIKLMLAGQLKEKSLFGQANTRRSEAFAEAFSLLAGSPQSAGHAAVWFVMDGPETLGALHRGLEVMMRYLAFCARENKDPLDTAAQKSFVTQVNP